MAEGLRSKCIINEIDELLSSMNELKNKFQEQQEGLHGIQNSIQTDIANHCYGDENEASSSMQNNIVDNHFVPDLKLCFQINIRKKLGKWKR